MHMVAFNAKEDLREVLKREKSQISMLTQYFRMNNVDPKARKLLYLEFPEFYRWDKPNKRWLARKNGRKQIGRMVYATVAEGERYYLRVLLEEVRGATSFNSLKTIHGVTCDTFRQACELLGVVGTDQSIDHCLLSTSNWMMPSSLRRLFAIIMVFCEHTNIRSLWDKHYKSLSEDFAHRIGNSKKVEQMVLQHIDSILSAMGKDIGNFGLPKFIEGGMKFLNPTYIEFYIQALVAI